MAVVVGVVINALPSERIKEKGKNKYDLSIIGAGDVVVNRLIPALERMQRRLNVIIYDIDDSRIEKNRRDCINGNTFTYKIKDENFKKNALNSSIVWIATPSSTHLTYLEEFVNKNVFVAIEKPLTSLKSEYNALRKMLRSDG
ncbi:Gfo/Idh/MocA family oxidoreductase [Bacteroides reticulotermitis]|nr:Gfo/Idh/MocA family oxidoreductase [Bacteroides reticulotermitis]MBB4044666.1 putative dehydrogenase [Bacteroides reticulotermitis]